MNPESPNLTPLLPPGRADPDLPETAAERLLRMWDQDVRPDLGEFLADAGQLPAGQLAAVLRVDQRQRWEVGEPIPAEAYLGRYPQVQADSESALDLIFGEFLLREQLGEKPNPDEFLSRFPLYAGVLREQIELHLALKADADPSATDLATTEAAGAAGPAGTELPLPRPFGRYHLLRVLGRGGMGTVYLAHDTRLDRQVALKVPHLAAGPNAELLERLYREARIAATFTDPHLCPVHDVGHVDGVHYLTMPFVEGEPLSARLKRERKLLAPAAVELVRVVARALDQAHRAGVVHRDLKPSNVMMNRRGEPVLMDFGLARRLGQDVRLTKKGAVLGTPAYMSPEQLNGETQTVGRPSDIYSLGVMLYELLTGRLPFEGPADRVLRQALTRAPEPPSRHQPDLDPRLDAICLTALAREPAARFASMDVFAAALDTYLQAPAPPAGRARRGRRLILAGLSGLGSLLGLLFGGVRAWLGRQPDGLRAGSRWSGWSESRPPLLTSRVDVDVTITDRDGNRFWGSYATEGGSSRWLIEGTIDGGAVRWEFTRAVQEQEPGRVVGRAVVEGRLAGEEMGVLFHIPGTDSRADLKLRLTK